jgi:hypothetical protein
VGTEELEERFKKQQEQTKAQQEHAEVSVKRVLSNERVVMRLLGTQGRTSVFGGCALQINSSYGISTNTSGGVISEAAAGTPIPACIRKLVTLSNQVMHKAEVARCMGLPLEQEEVLFMDRIQNIAEVCKSC